jgi:hypothetical protein
VHDIGTVHEIGTYRAVVEHPRLGPPCPILTAIWFKFDVGGEETEAPEVPRLQ